MTDLREQIAEIVREAQSTAVHTLRNPFINDDAMPYADRILRAIVDALGITEDTARIWTYVPMVFVIGPAVSDTWPMTETGGTSVRLEEDVWVVSEETATALRTLLETAYGGQLHGEER